MAVLTKKFNRSFLDTYEWLFIICLVLSRFLELGIVIFVSFIIFKTRSKIFWTPKLILFFICILISSLYLIHSFHYSYSKFFQQYISISILIFCYYQYLAINPDRVKNIFNKYLRLMYILSVLGLLQFITYFFTQIDIFPFSFTGYYQAALPGNIMRLRSIFSEAGYMGTALVPIIAYIFFNKDFFIKNKKKSIIFILTLFLTFATISFLMFTIIVSVKIFSKLGKFKFLYVGALLILIPSFISVLDTEKENINPTNLVSSMQQKISQTYNAFGDADPSQFELLNASSYATLTNLWVAMNAPSRIIGTGLGSHVNNYASLYPPNDYFLYGLNSDDGYSLFVRLLSEFGIVGIFCYFIFLYKCFNKSNIYNICFFFLLITLLIRGGNYLLYGTILFHVLYYFSSKEYTSSNEN